MWLIGLIVGGFIGAIGGFPGSVIGAMAGAAVGWVLSTKRQADSDQRFRRLEALVEYLQRRVTALENAQFDNSATRTAPLSEDRAAAPDVIVRTLSAGPTPEKSPGAELVSPASAVSPAAEQSIAPKDIEAAFEPEPVLAPPAPPVPASALWNFFFGGNALVRFGMIVLFFGVAFLLKYASEHIEIPIEARLIAVALGAIVMLAIGWRLREARPGYALIVQGGGIGVLYLTVFAAFRLYQLLPAGLVFGLFTAMAIFSALLAVLQDSRSLAAMAVSGGFLAPILASTGVGSHVALFSFYVLLNLGILIIAWFKAWRSLNLLGFAFTFIIGLFWGDRYYRPDFFSTTEPFLVIFFLLYVAIAVLFALRQAASVESPVDGALVFGVPLVGFGLQSALVHDIEYASAYSALALSGFYLLLAKILYSRLSANMRLLLESFLALGIVFGTLAIPLALDGRWTAAAWALEGAALVWIGVRQDKLLARVFGILLQFAAGAAFLFRAADPHGTLPVLNSFYLSCVLISVASLFSGWYLSRDRRERLRLEEHLAAGALFLWGNLWWFGGALAEIDEQVTHDYRLHTALLFITGSCALFSVLHRRIEWHEAKYTALALLPIMFIAALVEVDRASHPFKYYGFMVWPCAFAANLWLLRRHDDTQNVAWWHVAGVWLFTALGAWEMAWWIGDLIQGGDVWRLVGWSLVPIAILVWMSERGERWAWPVGRYFQAYLLYGGIVLAAFLWFWMLHANFNSRGDPAPLPYLPLLNPLDVVQCAALLTLFAWLRRLRAAPFAPEIFQTSEIAYVALGSIGFIWLNGVLLRTLDHWADVPFNFDAMMQSMLVQAALSIFWSVLALCTMVTATRIGVRPLWLTGAGLMAIVVAKLFFVDLSNVGGIERIVSFIGVGLLMLVVGYFSPVPPVSAGEAK